MLNLSLHAHCELEALLETPAGEEAAGLPGALNVAVAQGGYFALQPGGEVLPEGGVLAFAGPLRLRPGANASLRGVALGGGAAQELAGQLAAPLLLNPVAGRAARGLVAELQDAAQAPLRASALGYSLVCALAGAARQPLPELVTGALAHMRRHYAEVYGVEELAAELGVSKSYLIRSFTAATGISPGRYLQWVRLEAARSYLRAVELDLDTVAGLCGFSSGNYLCRVFRREYGVTPTQWRRAATAPPSAPEQDEGLQSLYL